MTKYLEQHKMLFTFTYTFYGYFNQIQQKFLKWLRL